MTEHFALAREAMETAEVYRESLRAEYDATRKDPIAIARLNDALRYTLTTAKLHSNLAEVQALYDLRAEVVALVKDLNTPPPTMHVKPVLEVVADPSDDDPRCRVCVQEHRPICTHPHPVPVEVES